MEIILIASFLGGILPAILWLEFWIRKSAHREPRRLIILTFVLGMISVFIAGPLEASISKWLIDFTLISFLCWAFIEEIVKFLAAYAGLHTRFCDDPIDPAIYLITSALGFAAMENILFLFDPLSLWNIEHGIMTVIFRSVGATVLHIIASGTVGLAIGFAFHRSKLTGRISLFVGLSVAVLLHTAFNSLIIRSEDKVLWIFGGVWILLIALILILEKIKNSKKIIQPKL